MLYLAPFRVKIEEFRANRVKLLSLLQKDALKFGIWCLSYYFCFLLGKGLSCEIFGA